MKVLFNVATTNSPKLHNQYTIQDMNSFIRFWIFIMLKTYILHVTVTFMSFPENKSEYILYYIIL